VKIIAHRGKWKIKEEGNTLFAFEKAFQCNMGIETDVRDYQGNLVISHDIPDSEKLLFEDVLKCYNKYQCKETIAINIKADGIYFLLEELLRKYHIQNYFVFDMSIPEQVAYKNKRINFFTRESDYETVPVMYREAYGVWMDTWENDWITNDEITKCRKDGKQVAIISPEIHQREYRNLWKLLTLFQNDDKVMLCTDIPDKAREYFHEKNKSDII